MSRVERGSRRRFLQLLGFSATSVGVSLLAACQSAAPAAAPTAAPAAPKPTALPTSAPAAAQVAPTAPPAPTTAPATVASTGQRTITVAIDSNPGIMDIQDANSFMAGATVGLHVYDRLFEQSPQGLKPGLAEKWETSADGTTWTFHLRKGVSFHDGTPVNAESVKGSIDRITDPNLKLRQAPKWSGVASTKVVDDYTLSLTTKQPLGSLPGNLTHQTAGGIQSPEASKAKKFPVGTGAYKFVEYVPDDHLTLEKNPQYWGGAPGVDRVVFKIVGEARTRLAMLQAGEADLIFNLAPNEIAGLKDNPSFHVEVPPSTGWRYYGFNVLKKPFDDVRVRQALNYAVDKDAIVNDIIKGVGHVADSPFGPSMFTYTPTFKYPYDPAKAKQMLADAGFPNGFKTTLTISGVGQGEITGSVEVGTAVQAYLQQVGVQAEMVPLDQSAWQAELFKPAEQTKTEIFQYEYGGGDPDALRLVLHSKEWPPGRNFTFTKDEELDKLFEQGAAETDQSKRVPIYKQIQEHVMQQAPWLFIADWAHADAWNTKVKGVAYLMQDIGLMDLRHASL